VYVITHIKSFSCPLKIKAENPLRRFLRYLARWLPSWILHLLIFFPFLLLFRKENSLKVRKKPSTQCPLMENGKATQRKMKAETLVGRQEAREPWRIPTD
jgi:hypothetical protein